MYVCHYFTINKPVNNQFESNFLKERHRERILKFLNKRLSLTFFLNAKYDLKLAVA